MNSDYYKTKYLTAYIHFRTGVLIKYIRPPENENDRHKMENMYFYAKRYMDSIGKKINV